MLGELTSEQAMPGNPNRWTALLAVLAISAAAATAAGPAARPDAPTSQAVLDRRLDLYNGTFRDILFVQLPGGEDWLESGRAFEELLGGDDATNLDYEHPPDLREDLLTASVHRVLFMLRHNASSSALFRVGEASAATRTHVCVITLDPQGVAQDDVHSTAHLLGLSPELLAEIPPEMRLDRLDFLRFLVDHEVFHCIDAHYLGPVPMSDREHWGRYMLYCNENGADAYAAAMHLAEHGERTRFLRNVTRIRALCLFNADPEHATCRAIRAVERLDDQALTGLTPRELLAVADRIRDHVVPDYGRYLGYRASACRVMQDIGIAVPAADEGLCHAAEPDPAVYRELMESFRKSHAELFGQIPEPQAREPE